MDPKVLAFYLPQFHRVPENDEWWGEGFTDWVSVKNAKPLFSGHNQPRIPINNNYYDLLEKDTMLWQASLMEKYSVDGVCMYHYWFKDGKRILEKPAENLLKWKDINMPFCFYWVNQTWARSWSKFCNENVWVDNKEDVKRKSGKNILMEQTYGTVEAWREHFEYLLPFFRDERYIKIDNKPLFMIFEAEKIPCLVEMVECWKKWAVESGLEGIYFVGANCKENRKKCLDAGLYHEPSRSIGKCATNYNEVKRYNYDKLWNEILEDNFNGKTYFSGVVDFDDTPRQEKKGHVIESATPEKFSVYLTELMAKSVAAGNEIVFLNAWNEWGESMYLEPDQQHGEEYLKAIPYAKLHYREQIEKYTNHENECKDNAGERSEYYLSILDYWMTLLENGFSLEDYLKKNKYYTIAIYGYGVLGKHLYAQLLGKDIDVGYIIDRQKRWIDEQNERMHVNIETYLPTDQLPNVDAVVVSATYDYDNIYYALKNQGVEKIISLESILQEGASDMVI